MGATRTVIVADDDVLSCEAMAEILRDEGYQVESVLDGEAALDAARRAPRPCAMVLDLLMPKLDGWAVVAALRADPRTADIPVVASTAALADPPAGATCYLPKPFGVDELIAAVEYAFTSPPAASGPRRMARDVLRNIIDR